MNYCDNQRIDGKMFEKFIIGGGNKLKENLEEINNLNVFPIPDGDTGDNMYRTLAGGIKKMMEISTDDLSQKSNLLAEGMLMNARGNSGVILSQIFAGISKGLEGLKSASLFEIGEAFMKGVETAYKAVITPVEGTILTVARESIEKTIHLIDEKMTLGEFADLFMQRMEKSLENTPELLDVLKEAGVIDSGGAGLFLIAEGVSEVIKGKEIDAISMDMHEKEGQAPIDLNKFTKDSVLEYGYCTEFLLRLMTKKCDVEKFDPQVIIDYLSTIGDSIVAFKNDSIVKCHVHTMTPSKALEFCQQFGEFLTVKIENMTIQHNEVEEKKASLPTVKKAKSKYASCAVVTGSGIIDVFHELGCDYIIDGGQGKNPSIDDFIKAFDEINSENIYVFPNNSNIIMAANQAKEIYKDSNIYVIPSKNIGQAYASLAMLDYSSDDPKAIEENFIANMECVETGLVCKAIRSVSYKDIDVKNDDYIGFTNKKILSSDENKIKALIDLAIKLGIDEKDIITVIYGSLVSDDEKEEVRKEFSNKYPKVEFYEIDGMQDVYDFIIILE